MDVELEAVPEEITAAGLAARALARGVGAVNLVALADSVGGWMPGGEAAAAGDELGDRWRARGADLARDIDNQATALIAAAAAWRAQDEDNALALPSGAQ